MTEKKEPGIKELIDNDEGLQSKRRLLTITSLILLATSLSGATVSEANTFILKITFTNDRGLGYLLVLAVVFLMIRYYGYARPYYEKLYKGWTSRMLQENFYQNYDNHTYDLGGLLISHLPKAITEERILHDEHFSNGYEYICKFPLRRQVEYFWADEHDSFSETLSLFSQVTLREYLTILLLEFRFRIINILDFRESLDVYAPYLIGISAIISFFFSSNVLAILEYLLGA